MLLQVIILIIIKDNNKNSDFKHYIITEALPSETRGFTASIIDWARSVRALKY